MKFTSNLNCLFNRLSSENYNNNIPQKFFQYKKTYSAILLALLGFTYVNTCSATNFIEVNEKIENIDSVENYDLYQPFSSKLRKTLVATNKTCPANFNEVTIDSNTKISKCGTVKISMGYYTDPQSKIYPLEWNILALADDGKALVQSQYCLDNMPYHNSVADKTYIDWDNSSLRNWLNTEFLKSFSPKETAKILRNDVYSFRKKTLDNVFILDNYEMKITNFLNSISADEPSYFCTLITKSSSTNETVNWWLRNIEWYNIRGKWYQNNKVNIVMANGMLFNSQQDNDWNLVFNKEVAVRPAMWIQLDEDTINQIKSYNDIYTDLNTKANKYFEMVQLREKDISKFKSEDSQQKSLINENEYATTPRDKVAEKLCNIADANPDLSNPKKGRDNGAFFIQNCNNNRVSFGKYQRENPEESNELYPIEWYVLDIKDDFDENNAPIHKAMLVSRYGIDAVEYTDTPDKYDWQKDNWPKSHIRFWLNNDFFNNAFTLSQQKQIITTQVKTDSQTTDAPFITQDKVFLLARNDIQWDKEPNKNALFFNDVEQKCVITHYAQSKIKVKQNEGFNVGSCWLREIPSQYGTVNIPLAENSIAANNENGPIEGNYARPVIWVTLP